MLELVDGRPSGEAGAAAARAVSPAAPLALPGVAADPLCLAAGEPLQATVSRALQQLPATGCGVDLHDLDHTVSQVVCVGGDLRELLGVVTPLTRPLTPLELASSLSVPLISRGVAIGTIGVRDSRRLRSFGKREMDLLELLADQVVLAVENSRLLQHSSRESAKVNDLLQFLSIVSHDLRTPLSSIIGFTDILLGGRAGDLTDLQQEFLSLVKLGATQLANLVNDLLDISRYTRGELRLNLEQVDLSEAVARQVRQLEPLVAETQIRLVNRVNRCLGRIVADPKRLDQVLNNLLNNAIKFTQPSGTVTVNGYRRNGMVVISVIDTGIGVSKEEQEKIFDRFYQADPGNTGRFSGSGLGLAVSKHIVEAHGGTIWVESEPGRGSRFRFSLPVDGGLHQGTV
ncbi:MAG: sensor histidine kinase [Chloroflexota bacterium]